VKGSYVLITALYESRPIAVGSLGEIYFSRGFYAYVGSALGGYKSRLRHHLLQGKKPRWHIDYLLQKAVVRDIIICESSDRIECRIADLLRTGFESISGFGASDCKCKSHVFYGVENMTAEVISLLEANGFEPQRLKDVSTIIE